MDDQKHKQIDEYEKASAKALFWTELVLLVLAGGAVLIKLFG